MKIHSVVLNGIVFVVTIAVIAFGLGLVFRSLTPAIVLAAGGVMTETAMDAATPHIFVVRPATFGTGWIVQLYTGDEFAIEPRAFETGGAAPTPGLVQACTD